MTRPINRKTLTAVIAAMTVSLAAPMALAQGNSGAPNGCIMLKNGQMQCSQGQAKGQTKGQPQAKAQPQAKGQPQAPVKVQSQHQVQVQAQTKAQHGAPAVGDTARRAPVLQQASKSRLPAPPAHQHYRVVDDTVVRVDDTTLAIVGIVGLASALLNK